jgi:PAS domain S-box-containing protein
MSGPQEQEFRGILDRMPIGIVVHRERRILYANRVCLRALGLERLDQLLGRDPLDVLEPDDRATHAERIAAVAHGKAIQPTRCGCPGRTDGRASSRCAGM